MPDPDYGAPHPETGWSHDVKLCHGAIVMPPDSPRRKQRAGVLDSQRVYQHIGSSWRNESSLTLPPDPAPQVARSVAGTWLWAGVLFDHFGHFLVESFSRLWPAHDLGQIDGICYTPKRPRRGPDLNGFQRDLLNAFGLPQPVEIVRQPTQFERLLIPGQGFGLGRMITGTATMRAAAHAHFGQSIAADGPENLYVSRSKLGTQEGAIVGEEVIEARLAEAGYTIYHPQLDPIATQIARYKAARRLIFADGSTGHMFAYLARPDQKVGYLPRRSFWTDGPVDHIRAFGGLELTVLDTIVQEWIAREKRPDYRGVAFVQHNLPRLQEQLIAAGLIAPGRKWSALPQGMTRALLEEKGIIDDFVDQAAAR